MALCTWHFRFDTLRKTRAATINQSVDRKWNVFYFDNQIVTLVVLLSENAKPLQLLFNVRIWFSSTKTIANWLTVGQTKQGIWRSDRPWSAGSYRHSFAVSWHFIHKVINWLIREKAALRRMPQIIWLLQFKSQPFPFFSVIFKERVMS